MDSELATRLDAVEERLADHARMERPAGLTEPDPDGTERWEAGQVWGHIAEFVPYWHQQMESIIDGYEGTPVPFGRTKADPDRIDGIEQRRHEPIAALMTQVHDSISALQGFLADLNDTQWQAVGLHGRLGEMDIEAIVRRFELAHLEEHAEQLDTLR